MIYSIKFIYNDGKDLFINIEEDKLGSFFNALNSKSLYYDESINAGFWADLEKIRYIQVFKAPDQPETKEPSEPMQIEDRPEVAC